MNRRPEFYPRCSVAGHVIAAVDNGLPCAGCLAQDEEAAREAAVVRIGPNAIIAGLGGPFLVPGEPKETREHAIWISEGVWAGEYEADGLPDTLPSGSVVLDVGAHCGSFARWALEKWGQDIHLECYEPNAAAVALLLQNVPGASAHHVAVTTNPAPRFACAWDWGSAKTTTDDGAPVAALHPADLPPATVLKCDAEGVEVEVLESYQHWDALEVLIYEFHSLEHKAILRDLAESHGFRNLREQDGGTYGASIWVRE